MAAALACIPLIGGLIFYILEKHDQFVRFYAMQSIIFGGIWFLFNMLSWILRAIFWSIPVAGLNRNGRHEFVPLHPQSNGLAIVLVASADRKRKGVSELP